MSTTNTGGPAFPVREAMFDKTQTGMTLRDYFAAKAMQAMAGTDAHCLHVWAKSDIAMEAYELADAMLNARDER